MIEIDGSYGEGGGQILRIAVALSAITGKEVKIYNIRAKRRNPGLSYQHLTAIKAVAEVCNAKLNGATLRSTSIRFVPGDIKGGNYFFEVGTAGSVFLVLQSLLPVLIFSERESKVRIRGGTDVPKAPPADYFSRVFCRILRKIGVEVSVKLIRRGFYPKGGGEIEVIVSPSSKISPIELIRRGDLRWIFGRIWLYSLPEHIAERMKREAMVLSWNLFQKTPKIEIERGKSLSPGTGIAMWCEYEETILGSDSIGERGKRAEKVAEECVNGLYEEHSSQATLDRYAADQIIPFLSLANGPSSFVVSQISEHTRTCMWLVKKFIEVEFKVKEFGNGRIIKVIPRGSN